MHTYIGTRKEIDIDLLIIVNIVNKDITEYCACCK